MHTLPTEQSRNNSSIPRPRFSSLLALWLGACGSLPAVALQPLVTDDTGTQGRDGNQLEVSVERERLRSAEDRTTRYTLPLVYTRGLTDTLDGYIEVSRVRIESSAAGEDGRGSGNSAVGFKWRFWQDEARKLSLALKPELQLGVSRASERHGLGNGRTGYAATFIVTRETSFGASMRTSPPTAWAMTSLRIGKRIVARSIACRSRPSYQSRRHGRRPSTSA
jgi:hypothetical protein